MTETKPAIRTEARADTDDPDEEVAPRARAVCPIVGIGGSAGAIDALRAFMPAVSQDSGLAYVIVMHLSPDHKSVLAELLGRTTSLPVMLIEEATRVEPDKVYVIPPNAALTIANATLHLTQPAVPRGLRTPIDTFLVSLAHDQADNAACIILSGSGSDGTMGVRAIKERGGLTLAQAGAEYDSMMRSALATGLVDFELPAADMPAKLVDYFRHLSTVAQNPPSSALREIADYLPQVYTLLRSRTGHDFSGYKEKTLVRRIQRRMQVLQIGHISGFIDSLRTQPRETELLFQDLLIGVTSFFRDPETFAKLETDVIPQLFEGKGPADTIRVWVPACSTGEEAYSIAMLLREQIASPASPNLQIFAGDIDQHALEVARVGRYPAAIAQDMSAKRLERFFVREDGTYRVAAELRELCLFSPHDLLRDAPFSRLDLISCRNLLIYLKPGLQRRVIPLFHYALLDGGFLMLGSSENVTRQSRLFATVDKANQIFRRRANVERRLPEFPLTTPAVGPRDVARQPRPGLPDDSVHALAERQILDRYAPAYVVINSDGDMLLSSGRTGKYLELPAGAPSNSIFAMARRGLRIDLRAAVHRATSSGQIVTHDNISVGINGGRQVLNLIVQPMRQRETSDLLYMVVFQDVGGIRPDPDPDRAPPVEDGESATLEQIEAELRATRERLQTTTEELESSNEELKSSNEELSSINEELQSSNEELETSREEMQSINEELQTVNAELKSRVDELSRANSDIANLLESTQIATVFLDRELAIKSFTPAAKDLFHLVDSDVGRPLGHVRSRFSPDTVRDDAERVLRTLGAVERRVQISDGDARHIMRVLPYRTVEDVIGGVVVTFADVTRVTAAEARIEELTCDLRDRLESLETLLDLVPVGILIVEGREGRQIRVNRTGARLLGEHNEASGLRQLQGPIRLFHRDRQLAPDELPLLRAARTGDSPPTFDGRLVGADGSSRDVLVSATPLFDERSAPRGAIAVVIDISQRKRAEADQEFLLHELQHRVTSILATVDALASRVLKASSSMEEFSTAFLARLSTMGAVHGLLSERKWAGAAVRAVAMAALTPFAPATRRNIVLDGADVLLTPTQAAMLGMALHELASNAVKHGALAAPQGRVEVRWSIASPGRRLSMSWTEHDGSPVKPPVVEGFGIRFIRRSLESELDGAARLAFDPAGLRATIEFPLGERTVGEVAPDPRWPADAE
jgi:two-component system CheB/CheR fusion protein